MESSPPKWLFLNLRAKHALGGLPDRLAFLGDISNMFHGYMNLAFQTANSQTVVPTTKVNIREKGERKRRIFTHAHKTRMQYPNKTKAAGCSTKIKHGTPEINHKERRIVLYQARN